MAGQSIGFIGVGRMGGRMARRLIDSGFRLTIFDTDAAAVRILTEVGVHAADLPAAIASAAEIGLASLPTVPMVEAAALELPALTGGRVADGARVKIFIDMATTGATFAKRIAAGLDREVGHLRSTL